MLGLTPIAFSGYTLKHENKSPLHQAEYFASSTQVSVLYRRGLQELFDETALAEWRSLPTLQE